MTALNPTHYLIFANKTAHGVVAENAKDAMAQAEAMGCAAAVVRVDLAMSEEEFNAALSSHVVSNRDIDNAVNAETLLVMLEDERRGRDDGYCTTTGHGVYVAWEGDFKYYSYFDRTDPMTRDEALVVIAVAL